MINERGGKDVDLDEFDASTCSGYSFNDIFDKAENPFQSCTRGCKTFEINTD